MKGHRFLLSILASLFCVASAGPASFQDEAALLRQSSIVFRGTVLQIGAVSFAEVPASPQTMVVRVDGILKKPSAVSLKDGDKVTVKAKESGAFHEGTKMTFYSDVWMLGSGVAVLETGHVSLPTESMTPAAHLEAFHQTEQRAADVELQQRLGEADMVVVGHVMQVHPWTGATLASGPSHISEHEANWHEAVVKVESSIKGAQSKQIVIRFPKSQDVAWAASPRFTKGQTGTFVLKVDQVSGATKAILSGAQVTAYTALKTSDVLPASAAAHVRTLLQK